MIASGDAQRIGTGNLGGADDAALQAMLIQAELLSKNIAKVLEGRKESTAPEAAAADIATPATTLEHQPITPKGSPRNVSAAMVKDEKSRVSSPRIAPEETEAADADADAMKTTDDTAMQID